MSSSDDFSMTVENDKTVDNKVPFTVLNTNARSLCPKINSLLDCFSQMEASVGIVTETWLTDGEGLEEELEDLRMGTGLNILHRNREVNSKGFSHGGVAVVYRESALSLRKVKLHNPRSFEVVVAEGKLKACGRKLVTVACYVPPNYPVPRGRQALSFIAGAVTDAKIRHDDPLVLVAGDFNQWPIGEALRLP